MKKRILATLMAICLLAGWVPTAALAGRGQDAGQWDTHCLHHGGELQCRDPRRGLPSVCDTRGACG